MGCPNRPVLNGGVSSLVHQSILDFRVCRDAAIMRAKQEKKVADAEAAAAAKK